MIDSFGVLDIVLSAYHLSYVTPHLNLLFKERKMTHLHSLHVACIAVQLGSAFGLPHDNLLALAAGALLHDIGKLDVPEEILDKPGKLTGPEFEQIKKHPEYGFVRLMEKNIEHPEVVDLILLFHHYYRDQTGYPKPEGELRDFKETDIPIEVRIVTVADIFCALVSPRTYKKTYSYTRAIWKLKRMAGQLHETVIEELVMLIKGNRLLLNTTGDVLLALR